MKRPWKISVHRVLGIKPIIKTGCSYIDANKISAKSRLIQEYPVSTGYFTVFFTPSENSGFLHSVLINHPSKLQFYRFRYLIEIHLHKLRYIQKSALHHNKIYQTSEIHWSLQ
jgi:hypothetical protein